MELFHDGVSGTLIVQLALRRLRPAAQVDVELLLDAGAQMRMLLLPQLLLYDAARTTRLDGATGDRSIECTMSTQRTSARRPRTSAASWRWCCCWCRAFRVNAVAPAVASAVDAAATGARRWSARQQLALASRQETLSSSAVRNVLQRRAERGATEAQACRCAHNALIDPKTLSGYASVYGSVRLATGDALD